MKIFVDPTQLPIATSHLYEAAHTVQAVQALPGGSGVPSTGRADTVGVLAELVRAGELALHGLSGRLIEQADELGAANACYRETEGQLMWTESPAPAGRPR